MKTIIIKPEALNNTSGSPFIANLRDDFVTLLRCIQHDAASNELGLDKQEYNAETIRSGSYAFNTTLREEAEANSQAITVDRLRAELSGEAESSKMHCPNPDTVIAGFLQSKLGFPFKIGTTFCKFIDDVAGFSRDKVSPNFDLDFTIEEEGENYKIVVNMPVKGKVPGVEGEFNLGFVSSSLTVTPDNQFILGDIHLKIDETTEIGQQIVNNIESNLDQQFSQVNNTIKINQHTSFKLDPEKLAQQQALGENQRKVEELREKQKVVYSVDDDAAELEADRQRTAALRAIKANPPSTSNAPSLPVTAESSKSRSSYLRTGLLVSLGVVAAVVAVPVVLAVAAAVSWWAIPIGIVVGGLAGGAYLGYVAAQHDAESKKAKQATRAQRSEVGGAPNSNSTQSMLSRMPPAPSERSTSVDSKAAIPAKVADSEQNIVPIVDPAQPEGPKVVQATPSTHGIGNQVGR